MLSKRLTLGAFALPLLAALYCGPVRAAELGEVKVNSFKGQQLSADIELVDLTPADLAEIQARLASPDVFKGAGLAVPPVLSGLYISVAKRDERRILHLTTLQPVTSDALHLFLELTSGGRPIIRAATLWLTQEPPARRVAAAPLATPAAAVAPAAATPIASDAAMAASAERAYAAQKQLAASASAVAPQPSREAPPQPVASAAPKPLAKPVRQAPAKSVPPAIEARNDALPAPAPPQACMPAQVEAQIQQCQAMTGKLVDLEGKVQRLQQALVVPPGVAPSPAGTAAVIPAPAKAGAAAAKPEPPAKPGAKPGKPSKPGVTAELEAKSRTSLIMLGVAGVAVLAVLGGVVYFLRKRRGQGPLKIWQSFRKKEEQAVVEPTMEEATTQE